MAGRVDEHNVLVLWRYLKYLRHRINFYLEENYSTKLIKVAKMISWWVINVILFHQYTSYCNTLGTIVNDVCMQSDMTWAYCRIPSMVFASVGIFQHAIKYIFLEQWVQWHIVYWIQRYYVCVNVWDEMRFVFNQHDDNWHTLSTCTEMQGSMHLVVHKYTVIQRDGHPDIIWKQIVE